MGSAATSANVPEILKNIWQDDIFDYMYEDEAFFGLVEKDTSWDGLYQIITVMVDGMPGRSSNFDKGKANKGPPKFKKMQVDTNDNFVLWSVDHKLIALTRNQRGALVRALAENTEKATTKLKRHTCYSFWGNGGGSFAKANAVSTTTITSDTLTLVDANDVRFVDLDDICEFAADDGYYATAGVYSGTAKVVAIDEVNGKIQFDQNLANISASISSAFLFHEGDYNNVFKGVPAYVTLNDPGASDAYGSGTEPTTIWGMDRSSFKTRLGGHRFTGSNLLIIESLKKALMLAFRRNVETTHLFMPPEVFNDVEMSLQGARRYTTEKVGSVGYDALEFTSQGGKTVKAYSSPDIRKTRDGAKRVIWGLNMDHFKFHTAGEYPAWIAAAAGGGKFMTEQNANATEGRLGGYGQLYTDAAGQHWNLVLT